MMSLKSIVILYQNFIYYILALVGWNCLWTIGPTLSVFMAVLGIAKQVANTTPKYYCFKVEMAGTLASSGLFAYLAYTEQFEHCFGVVLLTM